MLENVAKINRVVLACGTVDLRKGIDGLSMIIGDKYKQNPFEKGTLNGLNPVHYPGQEPRKTLRILPKSNSIT